METTPRSDQDYADLIAKLQEEVDAGEYSGGGYRYVEVLPDTAIAAIAAIEALVKERDEFAAVIDTVRFAVNDPKYGRDAEWVAMNVRGALSTAPADALREHDAALIESLADHYRSGQLTGFFTGRDGYTQAWLRERARQVREGET